MNDIDEKPIVTNVGPNEYINEVEYSSIHEAQTSMSPSGTVYDMLGADLDFLLNDTFANHGLNAGSYAFDKNSTHFTISEVVQTPTVVGETQNYFVNSGPDRDIATTFTIGQEQELNTFLGDNTTFLGIRAFSTSLMPMLIQSMF